jgi:hypothetical protein
MPARWVMARSIGYLTLYRRLPKTWERLPEILRSPKNVKSAVLIFVHSVHLRNFAYKNKKHCEQFRSPVAREMNVT